MSTHNLYYILCEITSSTAFLLQICIPNIKQIKNLFSNLKNSKSKCFFFQSSNGFLYAGLMLLAMIVFAIMAMKYKYVQKKETPKATPT